MKNLKLYEEFTRTIDFSSFIKKNKSALSDLLDSMRGMTDRFATYDYDEVDHFSENDSRYLQNKLRIEFASMLKEFLRKETKYKGFQIYTDITKGKFWTGGMKDDMNIDDSLYIKSSINNKVILDIAIFFGYKYIETVKIDQFMNDLIEHLNSLTI